MVSQGVLEINTCLLFRIDLILNPTKLEISSKVLPLFLVKNIEPKKTVVNFEYLGYKFIVSNPYKVSESKIRVVSVCWLKIYNVIIIAYGLLDSNVFSNPS